MNTPERAASSYPIGFCFGVLVALGFAVVIHLLPPDLFVTSALLAGMFAVGAVLAPPTVLVVWAIARWRSTDPTITLLAAGTGAITFDGLGIGFFPALYGQTGAALAGAAAMLLFAFATLAMAGFVMTTRTDTAVRGQVNSR